MRLYRQTDKWVLPGKQSRNAELWVIPDRAAEFCEWLNEREEQISIDIRQAEEIHQDPLGLALEAKPALTQPTEAAIAAKVSQFKTDEIVEFILDHASVNQCASILSSLGTRFGEHAKESRR